jgi:hypothetical protein
VTALLRPAWRRWKSQRVKLLVAGGVGGDAAKQIARQEALARQRVSPIIGFAAAKAANLVAIGGENPRFAVFGNAEDLTADQLKRLQETGARFR